MLQILIILFWLFLLETKLSGYSGATDMTKFFRKQGANMISKETKETGLKGFEPLTCGLRVRRYAELSYRPMLLPDNVVDDAE